MRITHTRLMKFLREAIELSDDSREKAIAALKQRLEDEGGAMGSEEAKETAQNAAGVKMGDEDFEALAQDADIKTHKSGDVVDTTGLAEGNKMKITRRQLRKIIKEELSNTVNESIADMSDMERLIGDLAGEVADKFGEAMESLWDEDTAMMRQQGYTDKSQWTRQVGSAEIQLEETIQNMVTQAINDIEMRLHGGDYYDSRDDVSSMGGPDRDSDGALDADELRSIADDLEG